ncbi:MAG: multidrug effflux MFS transporter [Chloroflexota bacterium]
MILTRPDGSVAPPTTRAGRIELIALIGALSAFAPLSIDMYLPALPAMATELGTSAAIIGLTLTACLIGLAAGQLVAGPLSDRLGRRRPLLVGLVVYTLASLLCVVAADATQLIALRAVQGMAGAAGIVISRAVVRDLHTGSALARFFALTMLVNGLAPILAPLIGGQLLLFTSWRGVFLVLAAIGAVLFLAVLLRLRESLPVANRRTGGLAELGRTFRLLLTDRRFVGYAVAAALSFTAMFSYISSSPFVLQDLFGMSPQTFSLVFACNALGVVVLGQVSGVLVGRVPPRRIMVSGQCLQVLGGAILVISAATGAGLPGILLGYFLIVASIGLVQPNSMALALADHAAHAGAASAILGAASYLIASLLAPLTGLGGTGSALPSTLVIAGAAVAGLVVLLTLTGGTRRRATAAAA